MSSSERSSHPSRAQVEYLVDYLSKHPSLAKGFSKVPSARDEARKTWEELTIKLNSLGGCTKTWKQWTKYWSDKKSAVKKKAALRYRARNKTGGGCESVVELSEVEEKILTLMGGEGFAIGDRHLEINPFEEIPVLTDANESPTLPTSSMINETTTIEYQVLDETAINTENVSMADTERPQLIQQYVNCIPNPEPSPAHTPPRAEVTSPLQAVTPSGSGNFPARRQLNVAGPSPRRTTRSSSRPQQRQRRRSPPSQRRQSQLTTFTESS
ncbi:unnamed protein product [Colias eurytheme]|nr:unnamed protein product [Colias eurytheme]